VKAANSQAVVVTGVGIVTPLGQTPAEVLRRIRAGECAAAPPAGFDAGVFACPVCARVKDFQPQRFVSEPKLVRLMNRDAQLAVAAARLALENAVVKSGTTYPPEEMALFGATGLAGLPLREVAPLIRVSAGLDGEFDLTRFGQAGLKAVSPILSFKILSNMPFCFVSINENIQGPNAVYTPWEGEGAQAVEAGIRSLQAGDARCALVGGCDVKTHELAFVSLQQQGVFDSWKSPESHPLAGAPAPNPANPDRDREGSACGVIPGEGAAFLVLETKQSALARGARVCATLSALSLRPRSREEEVAWTRTEVLRRLKVGKVTAMVSASDGTAASERMELSALKSAGISAEEIICPKKQAGDLFAAAALLQIALGVAMIEDGASSVLANCFGYGTTQAACVLEKP